MDPFMMSLMMRLCRSPRFVHVIRDVQATGFSSLGELVGIIDHLIGNVEDPWGGSRGGPHSGLFGLSFSMYSGCYDDERYGLVSVYA